MLKDAVYVQCGFATIFLLIASVGVCMEKRARGDERGAFFPNRRAMRVSVLLHRRHRCACIRNAGCARPADQAVMPAAFMTSLISSATTPSASTLHVQMATSHPSRFHADGAVGILDCVRISGIPPQV